MKNLILLSVALLGIYQAHAQAKKVPAPSQAVLSNFQIDNSATNVQWTGEKVTGSKHFGKIKVSSGNLTTTGTKLSAGIVIIDMNSLTCDDITDAESNGNLVGHLKMKTFSIRLVFQKPNWN